MHCPDREVITSREPLFCFGRFEAVVKAARRRARHLRCVPVSAAQTLIARDLWTVTRIAVS
jgi:hypothetical protein